MKIRLIKPSDTEKFVDFYKKLVRETDYLMFSPEKVSAKADVEGKFIENYDDYKQVFKEEGGIVLAMLVLLRSFAQLTGSLLLPLACNRTLCLGFQSYLFIQ